MDAVLTCTGLDCTVLYSTLVDMIVSVDVLYSSRGVVENGYGG
jgi:hypothetical protein